LQRRETLLYELTNAYGLETGLAFALDPHGMFIANLPLVFLCRDTLR
jgi:hypothetical protein